MEVALDVIALGATVYVGVRATLLVSRLMRRLPRPSTSCPLPSAWSASRSICNVK
jgi:hypothetical protein